MLAMVATDVLHRLAVCEEEIAAFCQRWSLKELALFGSAARGEMTGESDIDLMVDFAPGARRRAFDFLRMKEELESLFGRKVDVVRKGTVENPYRRASIERDLTVIYAA